MMALTSIFELSVLQYFRKIARQFNWYLAPTRLFGLVTNILLSCSVWYVISPQPQIWRPIEVGYPSVCHRLLERARTFEQKVMIATWLMAKMKGNGV